MRPQSPDPKQPGTPFWGAGATWYVGLLLTIFVLSALLLVFATFVMPWLPIFNP